MIYESKISYIKIDHNGNDKVVKEQYLINDAINFGEAESLMYKCCDSGQTNFDVIDIKRSKIKEIINKRTSDDEKVFVGHIADVQTNDDGEEIEITYKVALFARSFDEAYLKLNKHLESGYSMQIVGVKKTKFVDLIVQ